MYTYIHIEWYDAGGRQRTRRAAVRIRPGADAAAQAPQTTATFRANY